MAEDLDWALASRRARINQERVEADQNIAAKMQEKLTAENEEERYQYQQQLARKAAKDQEYAARLARQEEAAMRERARREAEDARVAAALLTEEEKKKKKREEDDAALAAKYQQNPRVADDDHLARDEALARRVHREEVGLQAISPTSPPGDEELARRLQEEEKREAMRLRALRARAMQQAEAVPEPREVRVHNPNDGSGGFPDGVESIDPPPGITLPPNCLLGSDGAVYNVAKGYKVIGRLKKK